MSKKQPIWHPDLFGKQWDVFNSRKRILLVCGSRKSGKTWSVLHRIVRHLWETPGARIAFFAKSKSLAKDGGTWQDLLEITMPEWRAAGIGFDYTSKDSSGHLGPKTDSMTRAPYFTTTNIHGGESEVRLFSIEHDQEVASKVKGKRFSMIFFSELSMFKDKRILTITLPSLRMPHLLPEKGKPDVWHQWVADTNPDEELGDRSWFYKVWYVERLQKTHKFKNFQKSLGLLELFMEDNPYVTEDEIEELAATCDGDPALVDSYVKGIHGEGGRRRHKFFADIFNRNFHVIGGGNGEGDQIDVMETSSTLLTGWDLGLKNHAAVILDQWHKMMPNPRHSRDSNAPESIKRPCFSALDEQVYIDEEIDYDEFTHLFLEKMDGLEKRWKRIFNWEHWSDDSSTNVYRPNIGSFDYTQILAASQGRIRLLGVEKGPNSIMARVRILRMLLVQRRLFISARCVKIIDMVKRLRKGDKDSEYVMRDEHKHVFDALTYPLYPVIFEELMLQSRPTSSEMSQDLEYASV